MGDIMDVGKTVWDNKGMTVWEEVDGMGDEVWWEDEVWWQVDVNEMGDGVWRQHGQNDVEVDGIGDEVWR